MGEITSWNDSTIYNLKQQNLGVQVRIFHQFSLIIDWLKLYLHIKLHAEIPQLLFDKMSPEKPRTVSLSTF